MNTQQVCRQPAHSPSPSKSSTLRGFVFIDSENPPNHEGKVYHQLWHWIQFATRIDNWYVFTAGNPGDVHYCRKHLEAAGAPAAAIEAVEIQHRGRNAADDEIIRRFIETVPSRAFPPPMCIVLTRDRELQRTLGYLALEKAALLHVMRGREYPRGAPRHGELLVAADWRTGQIAPVPLPPTLSARPQRHLALNLVATTFRVNSRWTKLTPDELRCLDERYARWLQPLSLTAHLHEYLPGYPLAEKGLSRSLWEGLKTHLVRQLIHDWFEKHPNAAFLPPNAIASLQKAWPGVLAGMSPEAWARLAPETTFCPRQGIARAGHPPSSQSQKPSVPCFRNNGFRF